MRAGRARTLAALRAFDAEIAAAEDPAAAAAVLRRGLLDLNSCASMCAAGRNEARDIVVAHLLDAAAAAGVNLFAQAERDPTLGWNGV